MTRLISGVVLAGAALAAILFLPLFALRVLACVVAALAAYEFLRLGGGEGGRAHLPVIVVIAACAVSSARFAADVAVVFGLLLALVATGVLVGGWRLQYAATAAFAALYIGVPLGMLVAIHARFGWETVLLLMGTVVASDTAQYYTGRLLGRRPLAPTISPNKTIEGAAGGVVAGTVVMVAAGSRVLPSAGDGALALVGLLMVLLGICGDLFESRLKRAAGAKDSAAVIPGHGGMLDRIDALLFAIPGFYAYLRMVAGS